MKHILTLLAMPAFAFALSKSGQVSVIVNGYITLPDINNQTFAPITASNSQTANTVTQSPYNVETSYDVVSPTPNIQLRASVDASHKDANGAFMTDNPTAANKHKVYFTMAYLTCGTRTIKPLIQYNQSTVFPTDIVRNADATAASCSAQPGELSYTRIAISPSNYPPSGNDYSATVTLTAQAAGA